MPRGFSNTVGQEQLGMINKKFERLLVLNYDFGMSKLKGRDYYLVRCDCGQEKIVKGKNLRNKGTRSCGCLSREVHSKRCKQINVFGENHPAYYHGFKTEEREFREVIRARDKVCQICGKTKEDEGKNLITHHLDGNHYNNDPENGALLCNSCHATVTRGGNVWRPNHAK